MSRSLVTPGEEYTAQQDYRQTPHGSAGMNGAVKPDASSIQSNENNEMADGEPSLADGTDNVDFVVGISNTTPGGEFPSFECQGS